MAGKSRSIHVIANQSGDWCGNLPVVLGALKNRGIATTVCALSRNDSDNQYNFTDFPGFPIDNPGAGIYNIRGNYRAQHKIGPVESGTGGFRN